MLKEEKVSVTSVKKKASVRKETNAVSATASARVPILKKKKETGCKAGDKCLFPHYKLDEQPNKKPKKSDIPKRREKR